ncbi:hypothetical protein ACFX14_007279 [Malus domestica]
MASRKAQTVPATGAKNKSVIVASGVTLGITTQSMAKASSAASFTSASTLPREQEHPKARAFDHLSLTKGTKGGKPKELLRIHALRCRFKRQFSHASHDHWSNFNR